MMKLINLLTSCNNLIKLTTQVCGVFALYVDNIFYLFSGAMTFLRLKHASFDHPTINIIKTESFPALEDPSLVDFATPLKSLHATQVRLVILNCPGKYASSLLQVAYHLGMLKKEWVWIVGDDIATEV